MDGNTDLVIASAIVFYISSGIAVATLLELRGWEALLIGLAWPIVLAICGLIILAHGLYQIE